MSPFRPPPTGKSISVAFALRACVRASDAACAMTLQWLGLILCDLSGGSGFRLPSGRSPVQLSCLAWLACWPGLAGLAGGPGWPGWPDDFASQTL